MKTFGFIELNDGSCFKNLQIVMDSGSLANYKEIASQNVGAALIVPGQEILPVKPGIAAENLIGAFAGKHPVRGSTDFPRGQEQRGIDIRHARKIPGNDGVFQSVGQLPGL